MKPKRILVAINSLSDHDHLFTRALGIALTAGAELHVLYVVPSTQRFSYRAAERLERMAALRARGEAAGVPVQTAEQHGDPAALIAVHANARLAHLIVIGAAPPRGWWQRQSVTERVSRRTGVPMLVVTTDHRQVDASLLPSPLPAVA